MSKQEKEKFKLPLSQSWLMIKSFCLSLYYQIWLSTNNYSKIKSLHNLIGDDKVFEYTEEQRAKIRQIKGIIKMVENKAVWNPKCYNLALLARKLLIEQGIPCLMKIGFRKRNNRIEGHAWVHCNRLVVSGYLPDLKTYNILKPIKK